MPTLPIQPPRDVRVALVSDADDPLETLVGALVALPDDAGATRFELQVPDVPQGAQGSPSEAPDPRRSFVPAADNTTSRTVSVQQLLDPGFGDDAFVDADDAVFETLIHGLAPDMSAILDISAPIGAPESGMPHWGPIRVTRAARPSRRRPAPPPSTVAVDETLWGDAASEVETIMARIRARAAAHGVHVRSRSAGPRTPAPAAAAPTVKTPPSVPADTPKARRRRRSLLSGKTQSRRTPAARSPTVPARPAAPAPRSESTTPRRLAPKAPRAPLHGRPRVSAAETTMPPEDLDGPPFAPAPRATDRVRPSANRVLPKLSELALATPALPGGVDPVLLPTPFDGRADDTIDGLLHGVQLTEDLVRKASQSDRPAVQAVPTETGVSTFRPGMRRDTDDKTEHKTGDTVAPDLFSTFEDDSDDDSWCVD